MYLLKTIFKPYTAIFLAFQVFSVSLTTTMPDNRTVTKIGSVKRLKNQKFGFFSEKFTDLVVQNI